MKIPAFTPRDRLYLLGAILAALVLFVLLNLGYFEAQLSFRLRGPAPVSVAGSATGSDETRGEPDQLTIESLGIQAPLVYVDEKSEAAFQAGLQHGVVHYPGTALPGDLGNAYYFGHSSDFVWAKGEYKHVFALLPEINVGDRITVTGHDGRRYEYEAVSKAVIAANDKSVLDQGENKRRLLTLQTSYPVGTALKRFVVVAELR